MAHQDADGMIGIGGRWWNFPGAQIDGDSWEHVKKALALLARNF